MPRPAAVTRDTLRSAVLAMLAEAGDPDPPSGARFRQVVSVRKLRARLGAGDPATLSRMLNDVETELVRTGLARVAIPGLPDDIADHMRVLWQAAVTVQLDEVVALRSEAAQAKDAADTARRDADLRVELLRVELVALREQISQRDSELATVQADYRAAAEQTKAAQAASAELRTALVSASATIDTARTGHAAEVAAIHARYEGLSRQLLLETEHQRHALAAERERLTGDVNHAQERVAALEGLRERLLSDLAAERDARQRAVAEAAALTTLVAEQRALLQRVNARTGTGRVPRHRKTPTASPTPAASTRRRPE
ncbi:replication region DNA-binding N-term [Paraburkholderia fungorum]|uniref:Replication region DNA-binding N-term n=1 Tax=Paraburkholderia fungorum TaxID=134537 RepID=A0A1H1JPA1_9BURK|nr:DNA-binding protein [Paraburkholderia fungorum]SDR51277.1 replication region DNA-binding N-term [Paraburkholderia fungorum]